MKQQNNRLVSTLTQLCAGFCAQCAFTPAAQQRRAGGGGWRQTILPHTLLGQLKLSQSDQLMLLIMD